MDAVVRFGDVTLRIDGPPPIVAKVRRALPSHVVPDEARTETAVHLELDDSLRKGELQVATDRCGDVVCRVPKVAIESSATSLYYRVGLPLVTDVLASHGYSVIHAGLVSAGGRGVLIAGASGAGKTTLCAALMSVGATLHSDDRVIMWRRPDGIYLDGLRRPMNVRPLVARAYFGDEVARRLRPYLPGSGKLSFDVWSASTRPGSPVSDIALAVRLMGGRPEESDACQGVEVLRARGVPAVHVRLPSLGNGISPAEYRVRVLDELLNAGLVRRDLPDNAITPGWLR